VSNVSQATGEFLSYVSQGYNLQQMEDSCGILNNYIARTDAIDLEGAHTDVRVGYGGRRAAINIVFPAHKITTSEDDHTYLSLLVMNSFDTSTSLIAAFGGLRGYCLNTQTWGEDVRFSKAHDSKLDFEDVARTITRGIEVFGKEGDNYRRMLSAPVTTDDAYLAIGDYCNLDLCLFPTFGEYRKAHARKRVTRVENMMGIFFKYQKELGSNEFAIFNTLSHVSSHGCSATGNKPQAISGIQGRNNNVRRVALNHLEHYAA